MSGDGVKLAIGVMLFGTWVALVVMKVSGADDIIAAIKVTLTGLSVHYLTYSDPAAAEKAQLGQQTPPQPAPTVVQTKG